MVILCLRDSAAWSQGNVIARVENSLLKKKPNQEDKPRVQSVIIVHYPVFSFTSFLISGSVIFSLFLKGPARSWKSTILPDPSESVKCMRCFPFTIHILMGKVCSPITSPRKRVFLTQTNLFSLYYLLPLFSFFPREHLLLANSFYSMCITSYLPVWANWTPNPS